jgi:ATP-dependent Zn protease
MVRFKNIARHTAVHEAGHAVIARRLMLVCGGTTIKADGGSAGHSVIEDPSECIDAWRQRGKERMNDDVAFHARILAYMAGAEAEIIILGSTQGGDGHDRDQIELMAEELESDSARWSRIESRLRAMTRMLVQRHRDRIERVAEALLAKETLSAEAIDKIAGRSVDYVKENASSRRELRRRAALLMFTAEGSSKRKPQSRK